MGSDFYIESILPHAGIIIKICRAYTDSQDEFEDYYQEVCLQIWRSRDSFRGQSEWSTWIYRLSLNVCLTNLRKKKKHRELVDDHTDHSEQSAIQETDGFANEDINQLYKAIKRLSEIDRAVILLFLEGQPYQDIAEIVGTNANNIGVRVQRIKARLGKIINGKDQ